MLRISRLTLIVVAMAAMMFSGCAKDRNNAADTNAPATPAEKPVEKPVEKPAEKPAETATSPDNPMVVIETSMGTITAELYLNKAPISVANFMKYTDEKFFDNTIFHRVISGFMIQGGGFEMNMRQKQPHAPIRNEAANGLKNLRGTLAMARTNVVDSATAQFFINHKDNAFLDHRDETARGFGYAVFGKVTDGMDVVDKIAAVPTGKVGGMGDVPTKPVVIQSIRLKIAEPTDAKPVLE